ncbi:hypothetical protein [uncultured Paraglaciecola sp.]|uniref:hypothetical protein n=1 Tax=uncultured Paraglaciecola sp. TaxID=1765024 RepID=UPI0030D77A96|tara:strand:+ start:17729 stop:18205 length:477 start_codon:yes stop_codon:yes gene_type:complete
MKLFQNIVTTLLLLLMSTACAANHNAGIKNNKKLSNNEGSPVMEKELILSNFKEFYFNTVLLETDKKQDRKFIGDLIQSPQIPATVELINCQSGANQLLKQIEQPSIDALTLYGSLEALENANECWLIQYQSMFSGGVSAFVDKVSNRNLLVVLNSEG